MNLRSFESPVDAEPIPMGLSAPSVAPSGAVPLQACVDALWRAMVYCLHPRVIFLSLLPLLLAMTTLGGLAWWGWADAVAAVRSGLEAWSLSQTLLGWMDTIGATALRVMLAPVLLLMVVVPVVVVACLLLVAGLMTPAIVRLVRKRRFPDLQSRHQAGLWQSLGWSLGATLLALLLMVVTLPLWFVPPFALILPPLIWGWLTYRVLAFDTLADLATPDERRSLLTAHRMPLLTMGVLTGLLGAAPSALWALGAFTVALAPMLLLVSVWLYTLVFAFSSLWFSHYLLAALQSLRAVPPEAGLKPRGPAAPINPSIPLIP